MDEHDYSAAIAELTQRGKNNTHRLDKLEQRQDALDKLVTSVEVLATRQESVEGDVKEIKEDVKGLAARPGKRWDSIVSTLLAALAGAFAAWLISGGI
nr:MAG TPA: Hemolysin [Caudoviricetes sp.]